MAALLALCLVESSVNSKAVCLVCTRVATMENRWVAALARMWVAKMGELTAVSKETRTVAHLAALKGIVKVGYLACEKAVRWDLRLVALRDEMLADKMDCLSAEKKGFQLVATMVCYLAVVMAVQSAAAMVIAMAVTLESVRAEMMGFVMVVRMDESWVVLKAILWAVPMAPSKDSKRVAQTVDMKVMS